MEAVREFEEHAMASGYQSLVKEAAKYVEELNPINRFSLKVNHGNADTS